MGREPTSFTRLISYCHHAAICLEYTCSSDFHSFHDDSLYNAWGASWVSAISCYYLYQNAYGFPPSDHHDSLQDALPPRGMAGTGRI